MNRAILSFLAILLLVLSLPVPAFAEKPDDWTPPAKEGEYDVPGRPGVKVRVFVHKIREDHSAKPQPTNPLRCDLSDQDQSQTIVKTAWKLPSAWVYRLNTSSVPSAVGAANLPVIVSSAFARWTAASGYAVTLSRGADTTITKNGNDGVNVITWGTAPSGSLGVTYVWYYTSSGQLIDSDTVMNRLYSWTLSNSLQCAYKNSYDAANIMTHELGHWFGLGDEYDASYSNATMYGYGSKMEVKKITLTSGDIAGTYAIYH